MYLEHLHHGPLSLWLLLPWLVILFSPNVQTAAGMSLITYKIGLSLMGPGPISNPPRKKKKRKKKKASDVGRRGGAIRPLSKKAEECKSDFIR